MGGSIAKINISGISAPISTTPTEYFDSISSTHDQYGEENEDIFSVLHGTGEDGTQDTLNNINKRKFTDHYFNDGKLYKPNILIDQIEDDPKNIDQVKVDDVKEVVSDGITHVRTRREGPALIKLLKFLFVKTSTTAPSDRNTTRASDGDRARPSDGDRTGATDGGTTGPSYRDTLSISRQTFTQKEIEKDREEIKKQKEYINDLVYKLDETLKKLDEKVSAHITNSKNDQRYIVVKVPLNFSNFLQKDHRLKRDVTKQQDSNDELKLDNDTVSVNITENTNNTNNLRTSNQNEISENVILQIGSAFKDIQSELGPIQIMKDNFYSDKAFKIGYIIANLENIELTFKKLIENNDAIKNLTYFRAHKILDKIELSKTIVSTLMKYLRMYTE